MDGDGWFVGLIDLVNTNEQLKNGTEQAPGAGRQGTELRSLLCTSSFST